MISVSFADQKLLVSCTMTVATYHTALTITSKQANITNKTNLEIRKMNKIKVNEEIL